MNHFRQFADGISLEYIALLNELVDLFLIGEGGRVAHHAGEQCLFIRQHAFRNHHVNDVLVAGAPYGALVHAGGLRLVEHPVPIGIDPHSTIVVDVAAEGCLEARYRHGTAVAGAVIHVVKGNTGLAGKVIAAANGRIGVVGGNVGEVEFLQPTFAVAVAAGSNHRGGSCNLFVTNHNARYVPCFVQGNIRHQGIQAQLHLTCIDVGLQLVHQAPHKVGTATGGCAPCRVGHTVDVHGQIAAAVHLRRKLHAHILLQPVNGFAGAFRVHLGDFRVHVLFAATQVHKILIEQFRAVLNACILLNLIAGAADGAASRVRRSAHAVVLFQHQHLCSQLSCTDTGHQTSHACTHHDYIWLKGDFQCRLFLRSFAGQGCLHGFLDGLRGYRCAGNSIHIRRLSLYDFCRNLLNGRIGNACGFVVFPNLHRRDFAAGHGDRHLHCTAHAVGTAFIHAVSRHGVRQGHQGHQASQHSSQHDAQQG